MSNKENTQEYSKDTLRIQIVDFKDNPIENAEVVLLAMGQRQGQKIALPDKTNSQGETLFNLQEHIKNINRFEITINHPDYYSYPINRNRKICRSYEYGHLCVESFDKIPAFYFNGKTLSQYPNPTQTYTLKTLANQDSSNQTQKEYYIQLQENSIHFKIYKDENLTQESEYVLSLETTTQTTTQPKETKNLHFDDDDTLKKLKKEIESLITINKKKGNAKLTHKFVVELVPLNVISLHFNGKLLTIIVNERDTIQRISFQAVSGRGEKIKNEQGETRFHFTYEKERQMLQDKGPIPEGEYYITPLS
ncbi:hypothetical protein OQH60_08480, partial [Campylobacter sp. MIT 21-1685]|nr:hypothetical protein [Campylobacter sp. MIT 21-1684]MCX2752175.1 hypothetical protein [Campylobacter sp. MIT 21-1682]MCX2808369.1 hypothetical protein [Campylobacter sp. MIT 21-1685]